MDINIDCPHCGKELEISIGHEYLDPAPTDQENDEDYLPAARKIVEKVWNEIVGPGKY